MPSRYLLTLCTGMAAVFLSSGAHTSLTAQTSCSAGVPADYQAIPLLVRTYAPRLAFADQETHFPTMPFFTEWSDSGQQGDRYSWDALNVAYRRSPFPALPTVFYRIRETTGSRLWTYLQRDEQALKRWRDWFPNDMHDRTFTVVEYYFYYLKDTGLTGHEYDREMAYVFLPMTGEQEFRVFVGEGHGQNTPANVLVQFGAVTPVDFIVELGGHSMAPTVDLETGFTLGRDVNWHLERVWGVRDLAGLVGRDFTGTYHSAMTLPRTRNRFLVPSGKPLAQDSAYAWPGYGLIPAEGLRCLFNMLEGSTVPGSPESVVQQFDVIANSLRRQGVPGIHDGLAGLSETDLNDALGRMQFWNEDLPIGAGDSDAIKSELQMVWEHPNYTGSAGLVFKNHLFRPARFWEGITGHFDYQIGRGFNGGIGIIIPSLSKLPGRFPGYLDFRVGLALREFPDRDFDTISWSRLALVFSVFYTRSYHSRLTWFVGLTSEYPLEELPSFADTTVDPRRFLRPGIVLKPYAFLPEPPQSLLPGAIYWLLGSTDYSVGVDLPFVGRGPAFNHAKWEFGTGCSFDFFHPEGEELFSYYVRKLRCFIPTLITTLIRR